MVYDSCVEVVVNNSYCYNPTLYFIINLKIFVSRIHYLYSIFRSCGNKVLIFVCVKITASPMQKIVFEFSSRHETLLF